jgi:hypothetical protein
MASERDYQSLRAARAEIAADEKAEQEARERPVKEAQEENQRLTRELHSVMRTRLLTMQDVDRSDYDKSSVFVSPGLEGTFDFDESVSFTVAEYRQFVSEPDVYGWYYDSGANRSILFEYLNRNNIRIADKSMIRSAALRLNEYNCFEPQPEPIIIEPEDQYQSDDQNSPRYVNLGFNRPPAPVIHEGWNLTTGEKQIYSDFEVNRMSSETYRRVFRLFKNSFQLPNTGPGPKDTR